MSSWTGARPNKTHLELAEATFSEANRDADSLNRVHGTGVEDRSGLEVTFPCAGSGKAKRKDEAHGLD